MQKRDAMYLGPNYQTHRSDSGKRLSNMGHDTVPCSAILSPDGYHLGPHYHQVKIKS